jgi:hypothetical protein
VLATLAKIVEQLGAVFDEMYVDGSIDVPEGFLENPAVRGIVVGR